MDRQQRLAAVWARGAGKEGTSYREEGEQRRAGVGDGDHRRHKAWVLALSTDDEGVGGTEVGLPEALHTGLSVHFTLG